MSRRRQKVWQLFGSKSGLALVRFALAVLQPGTSGACPLGSYGANCALSPGLTKLSAHGP